MVYFPCQEKRKVNTVKIKIEIVSSNPEYRDLNGVFEYPHLEDAIDYLAGRTGLEVYEVLRSEAEGWVIVVHDEGQYWEKLDQGKKEEFSRSI